MKSRNQNIEVLIIQTSKLPPQISRDLSHNLNGARKELVFKAKLWMNDPDISSKENQTRDISCVVEELAEAKYSIPVDVRLNEVVSTQLTPRLSLLAKDESTGLVGNEIVGTTETPAKLSLGTEVRAKGEKAERKK